jgi:hypothetical protein
MQWYWLLITDLHGQVKTKLIRHLKATAFSGTFRSNLLDQPIYMLRVADTSHNILVHPDRAGIRDSPWHANESMVFGNGESIMCRSLNSN